MAQSIFGSPWSGQVRIDGWAAGPTVTGTSLISQPFFGVFPVQNGQNYNDLSSNSVIDPEIAGSEAIQCGIKAAHLLDSGFGRLIRRIGEVFVDRFNNRQAVFSLQGFQIAEGFSFQLDLKSGRAQRAFSRFMSSARATPPSAR